MNKRKEVAKIVKSIEQALNSESESLIVMFQEDGSFSGEVRQHSVGYSASDRKMNGDYLFDELDTCARKIAIDNFTAACEILNNKQRPFGRGKKYFQEFNWYGYL